MTDIDNAPSLLTVKEFAELARVSRPTVYRLIHVGDIVPVEWSAATVLIPREQLQARIANANRKAGIA